MPSSRQLEPTGLPFRLRQGLRGALQRIGLDVRRYDPAASPAGRRAKLIETYDVTVVLDVGAAHGQTGTELRGIGYQGKIVSFEPLRAPFERLSLAAAHDPLWHVENVALGQAPGTSRIHVAGNSDSSSFMEMLPTHIRSAPSSAYVGEEAVTVATVDAVFGNHCTADDKVYMKIDTQGYEKNVLIGAAQSLAAIDTLQLELSLIPLYDGQPLFEEMCAYLSERGYQLVSIEPGFADPTTGQLLQFDGIFHRSQS